MQRLHYRTISGIGALRLADVDAKERLVTTCRCLVQAGQISPEQRSDLETKLKDFSAKLGSPADVRWREIAPGSGYTENKLSTASIVVLVADEPIEQPSRVELLHELVDLWTKGSGSSVHEVTAVIGDPDIHAEGKA